MATPVNFDLVRRTTSEFAELKWQAVRDLTVRAGVRHDAVDGNGSRTSPTVGLRYNLPAIDGSLKASYGEGFKPPSFFALGLPVALGGNPICGPNAARAARWATNKASGAAAAASAWRCSARATPIS